MPRYDQGVKKVRNRLLPVLLTLVVAGFSALIITTRIGMSAEAQGEDQQVTSPVPGFTVVEPIADERRLSFEGPAQVLEEGRDYHALLETSKGDILIDLYEAQTPVTVNNFVFLSLSHYYDGVPFHRVLEDFMAQTGDPTGTGTGGPGYTFEDEIREELVHDSAGVVSMANAGPGTNGSQFFITFGPTPWLDGGHTVFGQVVDGIEVLDDLTRVDPTTPSAAVPLTGTLEELAGQGIELPGDPATTLGDYLEERLGAVPATGQTFTVDGRLGVIGRIGGTSAAGFFPVPDELESVTILVREE